ncbi:MAG: ABC transporter ATP-binding protein [Clostridiales bacterium]|nr:ABC transporter ATP-binding protein [Clostridiales bacterium]
MIKRFISYYAPHKKMFAADMLASLLIAVCDMFYPMITRSIINDFVPNSRLRPLVVWCCVLLVIYFVKAGLNWFVQYYGHIIGVKMQAAMRRDVFNHLQKLPFKYFDNNKTGTVMSRIINDLMDISELAHHGPEDLFLSIILFGGAFALLSTVSLKLTLIIFIFIPFLIWFAVDKRTKMREAFLQNRREVGEINATLENSITGIRVSKAFTNSDYENARFERGNKAFVKARARSYKVMADFSSGSTLITDILYLVGLAAGAYFTFTGEINFGDFTAFLLFINAFISPIRRIIGFIEQYNNGMTGFRRFCELMDEEPEADAPDAVELTEVKGDIAFNNVHFKYNERAEVTETAGQGDDGEKDKKDKKKKKKSQQEQEHEHEPKPPIENKPVLVDLSFDLPAGRTVALVGPSGGGKTTICHLIPRFYDVDSGSITLDGHDVRNVTLESLRGAIGIVQQDVFLFTGTIMENIAYGRPGASEEEVIEAAKRANIHDFIAGLPEGYSTYIGERGIMLSGGQKQRISIARVFLKNPPVIILDEATSALDNATELLIQQSLEELCRGRTTLVVAHRLSTIRHADEIIVISDDGIMERGTHAELLEMDGVYTTLYNSQFAGLER